MIIGLTGKYCAGKNSVAIEFEKRGFLHIDVDKLGHKALLEMKEDIIAHFGDEILEKREISRKKLGSIVFSDRGEKEALEAIVHPSMVSMVKKTIEDNHGRDIVVNAAVLYQMGLDSVCDSIIRVDAFFIVRIKRALKRDRISLKEVLNRIKTQKTLNANIMNKKSDTYTIRNSGDPERISTAVDRLFEKLFIEGNK